MRELIWADTMRGVDATGLFCVTKEGQIDWVKECVDGWIFLNTNKRAGDILRTAENHPFIIGHNRAATLGDKNNVDHAHPIILKDHIALVHNGTLSTWPNRYGPKENQIEHDSTAIAHIIAKHGPQAFVDQCYGAYSLVWFDYKNATLNFLRNEDRPMAMVYADDEIIFYGSEIAMISWIAQRNNFKIKRYFHTEPHKLYTFEIGESEPKVVDCKRKFQSMYDSSDTRFRGGYSSLRGGHKYDLSSGESARSSHAGDDGDDGLELTRMWREANRMETDYRKRQGQSDEKGKESSKEDDGSGQEPGSGKVISITKRERNGTSETGTKRRVKILQEWKGWSKNKLFLFSIYDYGMVHESANGPQYCVQGEPVNPKDYPEIEIRATIKTADIPYEQIERSKSLWRGIIQNIVAMADGSVVFWVNSVSPSMSDDPRHKNKDNENETAVRVIGHNGKYINSKGALLNKTATENESCQGCREQFSKKELKLLLETELKPSGQKSTVSYRLCTECCTKYGEDREAVLPTAVHKRKVDSVEIRPWQ